MPLDANSGRPPGRPSGPGGWSKPPGSPTNDYRDLRRHRARYEPDARSGSTLLDDLWNFIRWTELDWWDASRRGERGGEHACSSFATARRSAPRREVEAHLLRRLRRRRALGAMCAVYADQFYVAVVALVISGSAETSTGKSMLLDGEAAPSKFDLEEACQAGAVPSRSLSTACSSASARSASAWRGLVPLRGRHRRGPEAKRRPMWIPLVQYLVGQGVRGRRAECPWLDRLRQVRSAP